MTLMMLYFLIGYILINILSFIVFFADKVKAKNGKWRISEKTLLILAAFGPFGATLSMNRFRHKTRKLKFKLVYVALLIHVILLLLIFVHFYVLDITELFS